MVALDLLGSSNKKTNRTKPIFLELLNTDIWTASVYCQPSIHYFLCTRFETGFSSVIGHTFAKPSVNTKYATRDIGHRKAEINVTKKCILN
jgi:hypothetical protein